jgi:hypothetical protein
VEGGGVQTGSTRHVATSGLLYLPRMIVRMDNLVEWRLAGETEVLGGNLPPPPPCPPQIPLDQTRARTRTVSVGNQRLTAWAMARTYCDVSKIQSRFSVKHLFPRRMLDLNYDPRLKCVLNSVLVNRRSSPSLIVLRTSQKILVDEMIESYYYLTGEVM